jgi:hypothetical protein
MLILEQALREDTSRLWLPQEMVPTGARLLCPDLDITIVFHAEHIVIDQNPVGELESDFAQIASTALATIKARFDLRQWKRFGARRVNIVGTDTIEEAERLTIKHAPLRDWRDTASKESGFQPREFQLNFVFDLPDRSKGVRLRTGALHRVWAPQRLDERLMVPPHLLPELQRDVLLDQRRRARKRERDPEAGLMIDIDYYWMWPPEDAEVKSFLNEAKHEADSLEDAFLKA